MVDELYLKWLYCFYRDWTDYENGLYTGEFGVKLIVLLKKIKHALGEFDSNKDKVAAGSGIYGHCLTKNS